MAPIITLIAAVLSCSAAHAFTPTGAPNARVLRSGTLARSLCSARSSALVQMSDKAEVTQAVPFEVRGFSYATLVIGAAMTINIYSFSQFFLNDGEASSSLGFVYGFPGLLLGAALKYAEVAPVPTTSAPGSEEARERLASENVKKIYSDITRFRYADAHLEDALKWLGLQPRGYGPPELLELVESVLPDGSYAMELVFASKQTPYNSWTSNAHRYANFFGPDMRAVVSKKSSELRQVSLTLVSVPAGGPLTPMEQQPDGSMLPISLDGTVEGRMEAAV